MFVNFCTFCLHTFLLFNYTSIHKHLNGYIEIAHVDTCKGAQPASTQYARRFHFTGNVFAAYLGPVTISYRLASPYFDA